MQCGVCVQGAVVANYPWDNSNDPNSTYSACPDDATFRYLAKVYADAHADMHLSEEFAEGITNGAQWYPISGGMQVKLVGSCLAHCCALVGEHRVHSLLLIASLCVSVPDVPLTSVKLVCSTV